MGQDLSLFCPIGWFQPWAFQPHGSPHDFTVNTLIQAHTRARTRTHARAHMHVRAAIAADV